MRHVLDDFKAVLVSDFHDRVHIRGVPKIMNDDDGLGFRADMALDIFGVKAKSQRIDVGEDHRSTQRIDRQRGSPVGGGRTDDFVPHADSDSEHGGKQRRCAVVEAERVIHAHPLGEFCLEPHGDVRSTHGTPAQHFEHGRFILAGENRPRKQIGLRFRDAFRAAKKSER